ncbi:formyltransferase family protein [Saccharibacillus sacchari]|uniref:formyltransferase family protein n=1 Tax=Saccharibacillus sacchari TaxID=456493 RepID=UPI0004B91BB4|nr:formyltransferase family protein [Saccharibacillus sacchari]
MKIMFFTGSHPRHSHVASRLQAAGLLSHLVIEQRESFTPLPPDSISLKDKELFVLHFEKREQAEEKFFGPISTEWEIPVLHVSSQELNGEKVKNWVKEHRPDAVISYGVHKISGEVLDIFPNIAWNIHGGLSPWYKGNITLFWPFYFLKPNWAGMTLHRLTAQLDGGGILHHSVPKLEFGDGIHDVACKAVMQVAQDLITILQKVKAGEKLNEVPQKSSGKLFNGTDWQPHHLRLVYELFNDDIVDHYLRGDLQNTEPLLIKAF